MDGSGHADMMTKRLQQQRQREARVLPGASAALQRANGGRPSPQPSARGAWRPTCPGARSRQGSGSLGLRPPGHHRRADPRDARLAPSRTPWASIIPVANAGTDAVCSKTTLFCPPHARACTPSFHLQAPWEKTKCPSTKSTFPSALATRALSPSIIRSKEIPL